MSSGEPRKRGLCLLGEFEGRRRCVRRCRGWRRRPCGATGEIGAAGRAGRKRSTAPARSVELWKACGGAAKATGEVRSRDAAEDAW